MIYCHLKCLKAVILMLQIILAARRERQSRQLYYFPCTLPAGPMLLNVETATA